MKEDKWEKTKKSNKKEDWYKATNHTLSREVIKTFFMVKTKKELREVGQAWHDLFFKMYNETLKKESLGIVHGIGIEYEFPEYITWPNCHEILVCWIIKLKPEGIQEYLGYRANLPEE